MKSTNPAGEGERTVEGVVDDTKSESPSLDSDSDGLYADKNQEAITANSGKTQNTLENSSVSRDNSGDQERSLIVEDLSFEKGKRTSRFTICVCVLLALLSIALAVETYFFVQELNTTKVLKAENERLVKIVTNQQKIKLPNYYEFEKEKSERQITMKANSDFEQTLTKVNSDLNASKSECDTWKDRFDKEQKERRENQNRMQEVA